MDDSFLRLVKKHRQFGGDSSGLNHQWIDDLKQYNLRTTHTEGLEKSGF